MTTSTAPSSGPLVGLTGRRAHAGQLGAPTGFADAPVDAYFAEYARSVALAGGVPLHLPSDADPALLVGVLDALVLSGGDDVDPVRYGAAVGPRTTVIDPLRDAFEVALIGAALDAGLPVLGICRGAQLLNVALGGTLVLDLPVGDGVSHASYAYPRAHRRHTVHLEPGSLAHALYGATTVVNSFHHQAVDRPGAGVRVTGRADDGVVEAVEVDGMPVFGVQWHPECFGGDPAFDWLVETARHRRAVPQLSTTRPDPDGAEDAA